jgi:DNA invertase Pin-like site-specific DNA recombinase
MNRAIGYVRVSTSEQAQYGVSLEAQEARLQGYSQMKGLTLVKIIREGGISGGKPLAERPGGQELLRLVTRKQVQHVVALKLDRLFRDAEDALHQTKAWDRTEAALHLVDMAGSAIDTSSAMGRFFLTMLAGMAEMERNVTAERTATALQYKRMQHEYCGGGQAPYGWQVAKDGQHIEPNPAEQMMLHAARQYRERGLSLRGIGEALLQAGYRPRRGGTKWNPKTIGQLIVAEVT